MKPIVLPAFSVFVGNGFIQHVVVEYLSHYDLRCYLYFVPDDVKLPNVIKFSYGGCIPTRD